MADKLYLVTLWMLDLCTPDKTLQMEKSFFFWAELQKMWNIHIHSILLLLPFFTPGININFTLISIYTQSYQWYGDQWTPFMSFERHI